MATLVRLWGLISEIGLPGTGKDDLLTHVTSSTCISVAVIKSHGRKQLGKESFI